MNLPEHAPASLHETDIVNQLLPMALQILQNDFHLSGLECYLINFQGDVFHLRNSLVPVIERTGGPGSEAFYRLMYRVDIPESQLAEALSKGGDRPTMVIISELLIIRALQKAYFRVKFT